MSEDKLTALENSPEVQNMPFFPAKDSVKKVDGVPAVKLSEPLKKNRWKHGRVELQSGRESIIGGEVPDFEKNRSK